MLTVIKSKLTIEKRNDIFNDWRDWFMDKDDMPKQTVHKTKLQIYLDNEFITEVMIPINMKKINCSLQLSTDKKIIVNQLRYFIPEMNYLQGVKFSTTRHVDVGDTIQLDSDFEFS